MKNEYELGKQKIIPAVLLYAFYENQLLMIEKEIWNGLGGKLNPHESSLDAAVREFQEEANCTTNCENWRWLGQLYFPNFKAHKNEDWWVNVFIIDLTKNEFLEIEKNIHSPTEGQLHWVMINQILEKPLWDGDREFLPFVLKRVPFQGTFYYQNSHCTHFQIQKILLP